MNSSAISTLIACQAELVRALDERDIMAMQSATLALAAATREVQLMPSHSDEADQLHHALKQSAALKIRVNTLADWTRQRIDRLAELRGEDRPTTYGNVQKAPNSRAEI